MSKQERRKKYSSTFHSQTVTIVDVIGGSIVQAKHCHAPAFTSAYIVSLPCVLAQK